MWFVETWLRAPHEVKIIKETAVYITIDGGSWQRRVHRDEAIGCLFRTKTAAWGRLLEHAEHRVASAERELKCTKSILQNVLADWRSDPDCVKERQCTTT